MNADMIISTNTFTLSMPYYKSEWTDWLVEIGGYFSEGSWIIPIGKLVFVKDRIRNMDCTIHESTIINDDNVDIRILNTKWPGPPLRDYQKMGAYLLATNRSFGLFDGCGCGKTIEAIGAMLLLDKPVNIIVAEIKALKQWKSEIKRFIDMPSIIVRGPNREKQWKEASNYQFIVTNYHSLLRDYKYVKDLDIDIVVFDEGSRYMRNRDTKLARMGRKIKSKYKWVLTGSPIENNLADVYSIYEIMDPIVLGDWQKFRKRHIKYRKIRVAYNKYVDKVVGYKETDVVKRLLAPHFIRRTAEEIGKELPDIVWQTTTVELSDSQRQEYDSLNTVIKEIAKTKKSLSTLGELITLRRICDSAILSNNEMSTDSSTKIDEIAAMIHENSHIKIIVFSQWTDPLQLLIDRLKVPYAVGVGCMSKFGRKDHETEVSKFEGDVNVMVASDAMSRSVNLQCASMVINMDLPWNPQTIYQRVHRARRIGSEHKTVFVYDFICNNTIEETMLPVLKAKMSLGIEMIDENAFNDYSIDAFLDKIYRSDRDGKHSVEKHIESVGGQEPISTDDTWVDTRGDS